MNKSHVLKELSSYLDNELTDVQKLKIDGHLKACDICSQELVRLKTLSEKLKAWHSPDLDASFDVSVKNEIVAQELERGELKMKKKTLAILIPSGVLAGILVFLFLGQIYQKDGYEARPRKVSENIIGGRSNEPSGSEISHGRAGIVSGDIEHYGDDLNQKTISQNLDLAKGPTITTRAAQGRLDTQAYEGSVIVIQPVLPATGEGEKIIRTAQVSLEVEDGKQTYKKASEICQELGGYIAASNFYKDEEGREAGSITMRIPKDKFTIALDKLGALGKVKNINSNSQDVSQEYANLKTQLDASMIVYSKMLEALQKRQTTIPEAMRLESELTPVLQRIEDLKNKIEYLNNAVSFTTITANFYEPKVSTKVLKESRNYIQQSMLTATINAVRFFARTFPVAIVVVIWFGIALGVTFLVKYWIVRLFKRG